MTPSASEDACDDAAVIARVRAGETAAYGLLVDRHQQRLRVAIAFHCRGADQVEEAVQEAFVQAFFHLNQFIPGHDFYPWVRGIAGNLLCKDARRYAVARRHADAYLRWRQLSQAEEDPQLEVADGHGTALHKCLALLPEAARALVQAHYLDGRPLKHVAEELGTSLNALRVRLVRIRSLLRACLDRRLRPETP